MMAQLRIYSGENSMNGKSIEDVLQRHTKELMSLPGVIGTAQGLSNNKPCIKVFVIKKTDELKRTVPEKIEGHPVEIEETGEIRAIPPSS